MVKKMKFVNIMGPSSDLKRVTEQYISRYDIQIEDAVKEMSTTKGISVLSVGNPMAETLKQIEKIAEMLKVTEEQASAEVTMEEAERTLADCNEIIVNYAEKLNHFTVEQKEVTDLAGQVMPYLGLDFPVDQLFKFNFIKFRFGRVPLSGYRQFETYLYNNLDVLFQKVFEDKEYVWGVYFVPRTLHEKVDAVFASLYFERIRLSGELHGKPKEAFEHLTARQTELDRDLKKLEDEKLDELGQKRDAVAASLKKIREDFRFHEMQRYVAKTKDDIYIVVGWMTESDAYRFADEVKDDKEVVFLIKDDSANIKSKPPTKLSNFFLVRPFEYFVTMYGLPSYNEIDPTPFLGITYTVLFGIMFGDFGQGLVLSLLGFLLFKKKGSALGAILSVVGLSSAFFGILFGSVFGYENVIPALWARPLDNTLKILIATVAFGIMLNLSAICIHILNTIKNKDYDELLFSSNGLSGLLFYVIVIVLSLSGLLHWITIPVWVVELAVGIPLLLIAFKEPLGNLVMGKKKLIHGSISEYFIETFFETFEIVLSFLTNTISFVRVGAFALCHAGMMSVVLLLAGASQESGGSKGNLLIMIIGNIFVMCLEGLIVGIQVLRLQYYEMFSRFFKGDGKAFKSFRHQMK